MFLIKSAFVGKKALNMKRISAFKYSTWYFCPIWNEHVFSTDLLHKSPSSGSRNVPCGRTDRQTDKHDESHSCFSQLCECAKRKNLQWELRIIGTRLWSRKANWTVSWNINPAYVVHSREENNVVKFSLVNTMKACKGRRGIPPPLLNLDTRW